MIDDLIASAELGEQARKFMESELGRVMLGMAEQEVRAAQIDLGAVDPEDKKKIVELQNKIWRGEHFGEWLTWLVHEGEQAMQVFKQQQQEG